MLVFRFQHGIISSHVLLSLYLASWKINTMVCLTFTDLVFYRRDAQSCSVLCTMSYRCRLALAIVCKLYSDNYIPLCSYLTGGAGFLVSANRILTKMLLDDQRANTLIFFGVSVLAVALCFILHQLVRRTDFVQFYLTLCRESRKITLEPTEDAGLVSFFIESIFSL